MKKRGILEGFELIQFQDYDDATLVARQLQWKRDQRDDEMLQVLKGVRLGVLELQALTLASAGVSAPELDQRIERQRWDDAKP